jgi:isomerase DpgB
VSSLSELADVVIEVDGDISLSPALVKQVNDAVSKVEDQGDQNRTLMVHIDGSDSGDGQPYPSEVGIHVINQWERALRRVERAPAPVLAVVEGACRGPAFDLLLAADYRLGSADANVEMVSVAGGVWPGMALYRIATQIGMPTARRLTLMDGPLEATEAVALGLIEELPADLESRASTMLDSFSRTPGKEFAIRRQLLVETATTSFEDALGTHLSACDRAMRRNAVVPPAGAEMPAEVTAG